MSFRVPPDYILDKEAFLEGREKRMFLIRVPKSFDIKNLQGVEFLKDEITEIEVEDKVKNGSTTYELQAFTLQDLNMASLVRLEGKPSLGPSLEGLVCVSRSLKCVDTTVQPQNGVQQKGPVPMPEGLKQRFIPFGASPAFKSPPPKKKRKHKHRVSKS